jgi:hypothetical protein
MPRVYDYTADNALRAEQYIEDAYNEGNVREVMQHIDTLFDAASEFETRASDWREIAEKFENKLVDEGKI